MDGTFHREIPKTVSKIGYSRLWKDPDMSSELEQRAPIRSAVLLENLHRKNPQECAYSG